MKAALAFALLLVLCAYASVVSAAQAESSFGSFTFQVTDLDPHDEVAPLFTWDTNRSTSAGSSVYWDPTPAPGDEIYARGDELGFAGGHTSPDGGASFASAVTGETLQAVAGRTQYFVLGPNTLVTFSAVGHAKISDVSGFATVAAADMYGETDVVPGSQPTRSDYVSVMMSDVVGSRDGTLALSFYNSSATWPRVEGRLTVSSFVGFFPLSPSPQVPEPSTYILVLIGIGVLGSRLQRKHLERQRTGTFRLPTRGTSQPTASTRAVTSSP